MCIGCDSTVDTTGRNAVTGDDARNVGSVTEWIER